jgi:zinc transport system ATP-binding protein
VSVTNSKQILSVKNLSVTDSGRKILEEVQFTLADDETLAIIGPNGAGKTVLVKCLLGLLPYTGTVVWDDQVKVGYVPQKLYVEKDLPLTVAEFLSFKERNWEKVKTTLSEVGFSEGSLLLKQRLGVLSGGELQRVLIAYALLGGPNVLIFDEPTSGVDVTGEGTIYALLHKLQAKKHLAIIFISHELHVVNRYADTVLCLNKEKVCYGNPHHTINDTVLTKLYGEKVSLYAHDHQHEHHDH